jgi:hypothetical protein
MGFEMCLGEQVLQLFTEFTVLPPNDICINEQTTAGPYYEALARTALKTVLPTVCLIWHLYSLLWKLVYCTVA